MNDVIGEEIVWAVRAVRQIEGLCPVLEIVHFLQNHDGNLEKLFSSESSDGCLHCRT